MAQAEGDQNLKTEKLKGTELTAILLNDQTRLSEMAP